MHVAAICDALPYHGNCLVDLGRYFRYNRRLNWTYDIFDIIAILITVPWNGMKRTINVLSSRIK